MPKLKKLLKKLDTASPPPLTGKGLGRPVAPKQTCTAYSSHPKPRAVPEGVRPIKTARTPVQTLPLKKR
jgi:hypothetical protein